MGAIRRRAAASLLVAALVWHGVFAASPVRAQGAFITELKAQNVHHFAKPLALPKANKPPAIEREWEDKLTRKRWTLSKGPVSIEVTLKKGGPPDGALFVSPLLSLKVKGRHVLRVEGSESFPDNPIFLVQIAEMDLNNPYPEVVFSTYSGGAHCCSDTRVLASSGDGKTWREIQVGHFDGGPLGVSDIDGDGRHEFSMRDNAFLYHFACYACSTAPYHVLRLEGGKIMDISAHPALRDRQVQSLKYMIEGAEEGMDANGFLAGYVAQKILLGEGAQAWAFMLKHYDRKSDWGLEACSVKQTGKGECPPGKTVMLSFPQALERFLKETGYELKK
ncbi:MAG: hypothetical protein ACE5FM_01660 [Methyloligellaceae bacterium]